MRIPLVFWIAVGLVGAVVGFLVGASKSPLASAAIPIFASLLTVVVTVLLSIKKPDALSPKLYSSVGLGYLLLLSGFVPAFLGGVLLRLGPVEYVSIGPMQIDWGNPDPYKQLKTSEERQLYFVISANLAALGVDDYYRRTFLVELVAEQRAAVHDGDEPSTAAWLLGDDSKRFANALNKLADCASGDPTDDKPPSEDAADMRLTARVVAELSQQISDPERKPRPTCSLTCKLRLLSSGTEYWGTPSLLARAPACGLTFDESAALKNGVAEISSISPLLKAALILQDRGAAFHRAWGAASGGFTEASPQDMSVGLPIQEQLK